MYSLFRTAPARMAGAYTFGELVYIRRTYADMINSVEQYYHRAPKFVDAKNLFGQLLTHIPQRWDLDDFSYIRYVEDVAEPLTRVFGFTSGSYKGKIHEAGVTLGPATQEVILGTFESFDLNQIKRRWRDLQPLRYLYHTRVDVNLPVLNNTTPGRGYGVSVVNIAMLALQYRYWLRNQMAREDGQRDTVYRFVGGYVLPNAISSYLDIAFFNRLSRQANDIPTPTFPLPHPFYLTDMTQRLDRVGKQISEQSVARSEDLERLAWATPMIVKDNLFNVMALPKQPITRANEWALCIARLPYVKYLVQECLKAPGTDRSQMNEVMISLIESKRDSLFGSVGNNDMVKRYKAEIDHLIAMLR